MTGNVWPISVSMLLRKTADRPVICFIITIAQGVIIAWVILSWVAGVGRLSWDHPVRKVYDAIDKSLQPVLRPIRARLPPMRMGGAALDLSPLVLIFGLFILQALICR